MKKLSFFILYFLIINNYIIAQTIVESKIIYENKGTPTQKKNGFLYANNILLPDVFEQVYFQGRMYEFTTSQNQKGNEGYFPSTTNLLIVVLAEKIQKDILAKGWYLGDKLYKGTPEDWIYVKWKKGSAFVSSTKIESFIAEQNLPYLNRTKSNKPEDRPLNKFFQAWFNNSPEKEDKQFIIDLANLEIKNPDCEVSTYENVIKCWIYFEEWDNILTELKTKKFIESYLLCNSDPIGIVRKITTKIPQSYTNTMNECLNECSTILSNLKVEKICGFEHNYRFLSTGIKKLMR